eukprot:GHVQ01039798.1.p1 GENE.GHVQ01039798.1~~GHVQ01039798.1.p1  ORF type:complete len:118 (-),score=17.33 GHVQ01039798.1:173-526(-)
MTTPPVSSVRASHLLIKHTSSRNPVSRRTSQSVLLTPDEAAVEIRQYLSNVNINNFAQLAEQRSDCSSYKQGGDLGVFEKGTMQKAFEEAAFGLGVGEISKEPVSTDSGLHIIYRTR